MAGDYSGERLLVFLKEAAVAGRMHPATARSRSKAAQALMPYLSTEEAADLRSLDMEVLRNRLAEVQSGELRSEVAELYLERLLKALEDFVRFAAAPDAAPVARGPGAAIARRLDSAPGPGEQRALEAVRLSFNRHRSDVIPIPLNRDRVVYLHGLPADLSLAEAAKIARVVEALAEGGENDG